MLLREEGQRVYENRNASGKHISYFLRRFLWTVDSTNKSLWKHGQLWNSNDPICFCRGTAWNLAVNLRLKGCFQTGNHPFLKYSVVILAIYSLSKDSQRSNLENTESISNFSVWSKKKKYCIIRRKRKNSKIKGYVLLCYVWCTVYGICTRVGPKTL